MEIKAALNNVIVSIDTKYISHFSKMLKMAALNPQSEINPADYVQIIGEVVSVPKEIEKTRWREGFSTKDIRKGDKCIMRYDVVYDFVELEGGMATYRNLIQYKDKEYWVADITKIFAVIRDNRIIMINGYCMIEQMTPKSSIILPQHMKRMVQAGSAVLSHIGNNLTHLPNLNINRGDTVYFNPMLVQEYEINNKKFGIISQKDILGSTVGNYENFVNLN